MIKKITIVLSILLNLAQIGFVAYFLTMNTTDNLPLFIFLFIVPLTSLLSIAINRKDNMR